MRRITKEKIIVIGTVMLTFMTAIAISAAIAEDIGYRKATVQVEKLTQDLARRDERIKLKDAEIKALSEQSTELLGENANMRKEIENLREEVSRHAERSFPVEVTAYTLGGTTATGMSLSGHSLESARAIAVDPNIIPLGSEVRIHFDDPDCQQYNGVYTAVDTGGAVSGHAIDLFMGHGNDTEAMAFGRRMATVEIL